VTISIRQAKPKDWNAIEQFIAESFGPVAQYKGRERWLWQFVSNPFRLQDDDTIWVWIAEIGGEVVGQMAVQPAILHIGDEKHAAGWIVDVMILPSYRGRSLGHRLHDVVAANVPLLAALTMAPAMRRIALRAGCVTLGPVLQFTKLLHVTAESVRRYLFYKTAHRPSMRRLIKVSCDKFHAHVIISAVVNIWRRMVVKSNRQGLDLIEIAEIDVFGNEVDLLWNKVRLQYAALFERNSRFLNWRYVESPDLQYRLFIARRSGQCVGYSVLRRTVTAELPIGIIVDFLTSPTDLQTIESLFLHAEEIFGGDVVALDCVTSIPGIGMILKKMGFFKTRTVRPTIVCRDPGLRHRIQNLKDGWYFTKGDQDWDQIRPA
jgi:hypothetical protein